MIDRKESLIHTSIAGGLGMLLLWLAHPPVAWSLLAWIAPLPLLWLIHREPPLYRRDYAVLWLAGALFWLVALDGIRHAHPALIIAWFVLAGYLGIYTPLFVGLSRIAWHRWRLPLVIAAPTVWVGLELIRGYALSGFGGVMLGHTQADYPMLIQVADLGGTYAVSALVMLVAASIATSLQLGRSADRRSEDASLGRKRVGAGAVGIVAVVAVLGYGSIRIREAESIASEPSSLSIALIQRNIESVYEYDPQREQDTARRYYAGSVTALGADPSINLIVWPESSFTGGIPWRETTDDFLPPADSGLNKSDIVAGVKDSQAIFRRRVHDFHLGLRAASGADEPPSMLVGCSVIRYARTGGQVFSGAIMIDPRGELESWYGKRHLVMFGEYIPFADRFPWLYSVTPLQMGVTPGDAPVAMKVDGVRILPSICFETMVERVTNNHLHQLASSQQQVDLVVNITNDGWFGGSAILDHHRRCSQLIAAAHHRPLLIAANGGPTVEIDSSGRIIGSIPHLQESYLVAKPKLDSRTTLYQQIGDWPARLAALVCIALTIVGIRQRRTDASQSGGETCSDPTAVVTTVRDSGPPTATAGESASKTSTNPTSNDPKG